MKTNNLVKPILVVALLIAALASFLAGTPTASAQEPEPITVELHGSTRLNGPAKEKTFEVPAGYSSTGNINGQKREGHPEKGCTPAPNEKGIHNWCDQLQDNEEIRVKLNDQECFVDWDRNPEDDQWFDFEHTCPVKKGINVLTVEHTGRGTSKGSVHYDLELKVMPVEPVLCKNLSVTPDKGPAPLTVQANVKYTNAQAVRISWGDGDNESEPVSSAGSGSHTFGAHTFNQDGSYTIVAEVQGSNDNWISPEACTKEVTVVDVEPICQMTWSEIGKGEFKIEKLWAKIEDEDKIERLSAEIEDEDKVRPIDLIDWEYKRSSAAIKVSESVSESGLETEGPPNLPIIVKFPDAEPGQYWVHFKVAVGKAALRQASVASSDTDEIWAKDHPSCYLKYEPEETCCTGQYQDFVGAVAFGPFTPILELGKEYFDSTRSLMFNVEYLDGAGQGDVVFRFNGQEVSDVIASLFNADTFRQVETTTGRAVTALESGMTKLIAYRYGVEQARIFQSFSNPANRWIHPLDQPFEHKYGFALELHGPANTTDLLVYGDEVSAVSYDETGLVVVDLTFTEPGLVAVYNTADNTNEVDWTTVELVTYPISHQQTVSYDFAETGLYHYRLVDAAGQLVAGPASTTHFEFKAEPGMTYSAQLAYPVTSLFVGLYDDMKFRHPDYWTMPIDGRLEHDFEFHLDYHRLPDPDLGNDHIRGDVVVDGLTLSYGTTSVAQQFPYGRHDGARIGVNIVGIPNVSMIAFCQRPGYHEVVYWGGWENESYYLPDRGWVFDEEMADEWNEDQRGECIDTARRVNMELARQGLRTDHTFRHHDERSQGYQMVQQHIWSPYNLVGMRPPHLGQIFKPGKVLAYYEDPEEILFWGWDLDKSGLADGIGAYELQKHVASLGPAQYVDMTGIHPPEDVYVPEQPTVQAVLEPAAPAPSPAAPKLTPEEPMPEPTPEPTPEPPASAPETPDDLIPQPPRLAPEPTPTT